MSRRCTAGMVPAGWVCRAPLRAQGGIVARWVSGYPGTSSATPEGALQCARHEEGRTMRLARLRCAAVAALVIATVVNAGGSAYAAAPSNDTYPGRVVVGALPFSATLDTTEATTDADDAELNANCGAPATDASVWYQHTAATDSGLVADMSTSSYPAVEPRDHRGQRHVRRWQGGERDLRGGVRHLRVRHRLRGARRAPDRPEG